MKSVILFFDRLLRKYTPDPFVIAILLTALTLVLAVVLTDKTSSIVVNVWGNGFWELASFTLQMAMILLGGYVVATAPPVKKLLLLMVQVVRTPVQAVLFCTLSACLASWVNWGFGLVVGGIVALEVGRKMTHVPFRLLVASSYSGFLVWHSGLSGSIPLTLNTPGNDWQPMMGGLIPLSDTIFSPINLIALGAMLILLPAINLLQLRIVGDEKIELNLVPTVESEAVQAEPQFLERSVWMSWILVGIGVFYLYTLLKDSNFNLNLNTINFIFFMAGLLLHGSPGAFMTAIVQAIPKVAPILIQYPLYAAIMAVLKGTGLGQQMAEFFVGISTAETFPLMTFYSAGLINLFVPSGGGQWAVQAPIAITAAQELGADIPKTIMAVAWGDAWTNMAQPFWALPLLAIAGLSIKDIIGFCLVTLIASGVVLSLIFLLL